MLRFLHLLPAFLLAANAVLLFHSIHQHSVTIDEAGHIASGVMNWQTETYNAYRVNPPMTRMLAVLPVLASNPERLPDYQALARDADDRVESKIGKEFAEKNRERYPELVHRARYMGIVWSLLGGWVLFSWSRQLYGYRGACLALAVWCFEPNLMAHAQLVTPDFPSAAAALLASYSLWLYLRDPCWARAWIAGLGLGFALMTKFTLLVFLPLWIVFVVFIRYPEPDRPSIRSRCGHGILALFLAVLVINLGYNFRDTGLKLGHIPFISHTLGGERVHDPIHVELVTAGNRFAGTWLDEFIVPLPADYLRGIDVQHHDFEIMHKHRWSYLAGEWKEYGWWHYYLYALGVKVPIGFLVLFIAAIALAIIRHPASASWRDELVVATPGVAILVLVSSQTGFNHHSRYVLAALPFFILGTGKFGNFLDRSRWKRGLLVVILIAWGIVSAVRVYPHSLSYFNEIAGGPENGSAHLIDSNIDWGQDLPALKRWMDAHPEARPMRAVCFTFIDPTIYGLEKMESPPRGPGFAPAEECGPLPGWYVLSVNAVRGMGVVGEAHSYQYFEKFAPVGRIGYSMLVYRITDDDAIRVRRQMGLPELPRRLDE